MPDRAQVFVAYSARDEALANTVLDAVRHANALPLPIIYQPWPFNDISGAPIISPILEKIEDSAFIVADITYLNLNVVYEIGFAIGRRKRVFLIRHQQIAGDKATANTVGIFDTLGYYEYENIEHLTNRLSAHIDEDSLPFSTQLDQKSPVYLIEPSDRGVAVGMMVSCIKKAGYGRYRSFTPDEDLRLSATDAIRQIAASSGIFIPMEDDTTDGGVVHNIRCMFLAGLADGMGKPKLILAPFEYQPPLDIRDDVEIYNSPTVIPRIVAAFCPKIVEYSSQAEPSGIDRHTLLQSLSIGDPRAENEMATLEQYYLPTDQYERASRGEVNLVVGRKGSGKTALFIQLRDKIRADRRNIVVDLKPEGYQLIKVKEDILEYVTEGACQHLITAFWEYLILLEIAYKLLEKDQHSYRYMREVRDVYVRLDRNYHSDPSSEGDFSERLTTLSETLAAKYRVKYGTHPDRRLTAAEVTELVYTHDIRQLRKDVSEYLSRKQSVWVLFDNLDKGWSTQGVDVIDAIVLRCLVDAGRKVARDMARARHSVNCIVFVRNDVYDHLMRNSADYGKEMRATLDWNDPDLLREMLRLRLVAGLHGGVSKIDFSTVWRELFVSHYKGEETSAYLIERCLMRPRNLLKIFNHCRGFATNFNHEKIDEDDIDKGLGTYSYDLLKDLSRELSDVLPLAENILYQFIDCPSTMSYESLVGILAKGDIGNEQTEDVVQFLLYYGVLGIRMAGQTYFIYDVNYDLKMLKTRAERTTERAPIVVNPAFWPALGIRDVTREGTADLVVWA
jgi:hypothetical protein